MNAEGATSTTVSVRGQRFERLAIRTHWIESGEDMAGILERYLAPHSRPGDWLLISEKVMAISLGDMIPAERLQPGRLARLLSRSIRPTATPGLQVPEKMQYVVETAGASRVMLGALVSAVTRPFGIRGAFDSVVGKWSRYIDGMSPPFDNFVIPPMRAERARTTAQELAARLAMPTAILDLNNLGGTIRAASDDLDHALLLEALSGNPLGQGMRGTPIGLLRRLDAESSEGR